LFPILPKNQLKNSVLVARAEFDKYFVRFLEELRTRQFAFKIISPLISSKVAKVDSALVVDFAFNLNQNQ